MIPIAVLEDGAGATHGLGDEEGRLLGGIVEARGVELHEFQVTENTAGAVDHSYAVARGDDRRSGGGVNVSHAAGGQQGDLGQVGINSVGIAIEGIDTIALNIGRVLGDTLAEVVLRDDVDGELALFDFDVGMGAGGCEQPAFYLLTSVVLVVEDAKLGVSAFAVEVEPFSPTLAVKVHPVLHQLADAVGGFADGHLHDLAVADAVAGDEGIVDMLVKAVAIIHYRCNAALGVAGAALGSVALGEDAHPAVRGYLEGKREAGDAGAYH